MNFIQVHVVNDAKFAPNRGRLAGMFYGIKPKKTPPRSITKIARSGYLLHAIGYVMLGQNLVKKFR